MGYSESLDGGILSNQELLELNARKEDALKKSRGRRRNYIDNEFNNGGLVGIFSLFFSKSAFKHGWEKEENLHRPPEQQIIATKDPTNKIYAFSIATAVIAVGVIGGIIAYPFGGAFIAAGVFCGMGVGSMVGAVKGYFEAGKIRREITEGRSAVKETIHEIKQDGRQRAGEEKRAELEQKLQLLEAKLEEKSDGRNSIIRKRLEKDGSSEGKIFVEKVNEAAQANQMQLQRLL